MPDPDFPFPSSFPRPQRYDFEYMRYGVSEYIHPHRAEFSTDKDYARNVLIARLSASFASREMKPETTTETTEYSPVVYPATLRDHFKAALKDHQFFGKFKFIQNLKVEYVTVNHVKTVTNTTRRFHVCPHNFYMGESRPGAGNCLSFMTCDDEDKRKQEYYLAAIRNALREMTGGNPQTCSHSMCMIPGLRQAVEWIDAERGVK